MTITLQRCDSCGTPNYPRRTLCRSCLADALTDTADPGTGQLLAVATLHRSFDPSCATSMPLRIGTVRLDTGPHLVAWLANGLHVDDRVQLSESADALGRTVFCASREPQPVD